MSKITRNDIYVRSENGGGWFDEFLRSLAEEKESSVQDVIDAIQYKRSETVQGVVDKYRKMVGLDNIKAYENETDLEVKASMFEKVYRNSPKTLELKNKIDEFADSLANWNLKYDEFPSINKWVDKNMDDFPYGQDEVIEYLGNVMSSRSQSYWDTSVEGRTHPDKKKLMAVLADLAGDEGKTAASCRPLSIRHAKIMDDKKDIILIIDKDPKIREDIKSMCEHSGGTKNTHSIINHLREKLGKDLISYSDNDLIDFIEKVKKEYQGDTEEQSADVGKVGTDIEDHPEDNAADYITHGKGN